MRNRLCFEEARRLIWTTAPIAGVLSVLFPAQAQIIPASGGTNTSVSQKGNVFDISGGTQAEGNLFHEFESFSVDDTQTANFLSDSSVFNIFGQVSGLSPSYINGMVQVSGSDANLYLVNPAGILFGPSGQLSLGGSFAAATADQIGFGENWVDVLASNDDYSAYTGDFSAFGFTVDTPGSVVNRGELSVEAGESLVLIGNNVVNEGRLAAPGGEVGLVAVGRDTVRLGLPGSLLSLEVSESDIFAGGAFAPTDLPNLVTGDVSGGASRLVINLSGTVALTGLQRRTVEPEEVAVTGEITTRTESAEGGTIALLGRSIDVLAASIDASGKTGGSIRIGRELGEENLPDTEIALFEGGSVARADGLGGAGGDIAIGSNRSAYLYDGLLSVKGSTQGGFVETSADYLTMDGLTVSASGKLKSGQWLVDPVDIAIVDTVSGPNEIAASAIEDSLDSGTDVTIETTLGTGGSGDISLLNSISQTGASTASLTLTGRRFSTNGSTIDLASTGGLTFDLNAVNPEAVTSGESVERAIAAIGNVNGDRTINLGAGTYNFSDTANIDTDVDIIGASSAATQLNLDADDRRLFHIGSDSTVGIRDVALGVAAGRQGGGIWNRGTLELNNIYAAGNTADFGGAIVNAPDSQLDILNSTFENNLANAAGGVIFSSNGSIVNIVGSQLENNQASRSGGALYIDEASATIEDSIVRNNTAIANDGGGIRTNDANLTVRRVLIENNRAGDDGGGAAIQGGSNIALFEDVTFRENATTALSNDGGAVVLWDDAAAIFTDSLFERNSATGDGGAIHSGQAGQIAIDRSRFVENIAGGHGGGFVSESGSRVSITNSLFDSNNAVDEGGGLHSVDSIVDVSGTTTFQDNTASEGAGIYVTGGTVLTLSDAEFTNNVADTHGGGILSDSADVNVLDSVFSSNDADGGGGGVRGVDSAIAISGTTFENNTAAGGGGLDVVVGSRATVSNSSFTNNRATATGGGIHALGDIDLTLDSVTFTNNTAGDRGGGLNLSTRSTATIENSQFAGNSAQDGGGITVTESTVDLANSSIENNTASNDGGGISIGEVSAATVDNINFIGNAADDDGGGLYVEDDSQATVTNSLFEGNRANDDGGGLSVSEGSTATVDSTDFVRNQATNEGGGLRVIDDAAVDVVGGTFADNGAGDRGGGASVYEDARARFEGTQFVSNTSGDEGGGLSVELRSEIQVANVRFENNTADGDGGGVSIEDFSTGTIDNTNFVGNRSIGDDGGGLYVSNDGAATVLDSRFELNRAGDFGGGLYESDNSQIDGDRLDFVRNQASTDGGGISVRTGASIRLNDILLSENMADRDGGGAAIADNASAELTSVTVVRNTAVNDGGGFHIDDSGVVEISDASLSDNVAGTDGGAIAAVGDSQTVVIRSSLDGNQAGRNGGAINLSDRATLDISAASLANNSAAESGGALSLSASTTSALESAVINDNTAGSDGGGLYTTGQTTLDSVTLQGNQAETGGAIAVAGSGDLTIVANTVIENNRASGQGGGVAGLQNSQLTILGSVTTDADGIATSSTTRVENNTAATKDGGGILVRNQSQLNLTGVLVRGNTAGDDGGGVAVTEASQADIADSNIENNSATDEGGGLYRNNLGTPVVGETLSVVDSRFIRNESADGGGLFAGQDMGESTVRNSLFRENEATRNGGGLHSAEAIALENTTVVGNTAANNGGGLHLENAFAEIIASTFEGNEANHGGGIATLSSDLALRDSAVKSNRAVTDGGGLRLYNGTATVENSDFTNNQGAYGGGLELSINTAASVSDSEFSGNTASIRGGAIQTDEASALRLERSTLDSNQTEGAGGGLFNRGTSELVNVTLYGNEARGTGGAIAIENPSAIVIRNSTVSGNRSDDLGGGLFSDGAADVKLLNTIVAENQGASANDVSGRFVDEGNNLIGQSDGSTGFTKSLLVGRVGNSINPSLAPLADNGGLTRTQLLSPDSVAIDAGANANLPGTDQRGLSRMAGTSVDIGAVELTGAERANFVPPPPVPPNPKLAFLDPSLTAQSQEWVAIATEDEDADNRTISQLERTFGRSFEDYWDLPLRTPANFEDVQSVLKRAQEEYKVNSAIIYAMFLPEQIGLDTGEDTVYVEPTAAPDDLLHLALVMPEGELVRYQLQVTREQATRQVDLLRSTIADPADTASYKPLTQQLYRWLLAPLEEDLERQGIQNLMYALDTGLRNAPVVAMRDALGFSLERYGISVVPNMGLTQVDFSPSVKRSTVAMGISQFESASPLPAVPIELAMVKEVVTAASTTLNEGMTIDALESVQALEKPGVLHLATHASFDHYSPESSAIAMWNESLSMKDFAELDWLESDLELLILSACSTAISSANAELGFAGLAAAAGVEATVGSLWEVSDVGTLALMSEFYTQLEQTNLRFEALRQAQLSLLKGKTRIQGGDLITARGVVDLPDEWDLPQEATLEHPFFWSAFTMVGNPW